MCMCVPVYVKSPVRRENELFGPSWGERGEGKKTPNEPEPTESISFRCRRFLTPFPSEVGVSPLAFLSIFFSPPTRPAPGVVMRKIFRNSFPNRFASLGPFRSKVYLEIFLCLDIILCYNFYDCLWKNFARERRSPMWDESWDFVTRFWDLLTFCVGIWAKNEGKVGELLGLAELLSGFCHVWRD